MKAPHNTTGSFFSRVTDPMSPISTKSAPLPPRRKCVPLVEVQEVFDKMDLNSQWDETFVTKQYYMWMPNPRKGRTPRQL